MIQGDLYRLEQKSVKGNNYDITAVKAGYRCS